MMMSGWLPPCHEGAADCRPVRFFLSFSSRTSSLAHLHASSLIQPFSVSRHKGFQSHIHFSTMSLLSVNVMSSPKSSVASLSPLILKFFFVIKVICLPVKNILSYCAFSYSIVLCLLKLLVIFFVHPLASWSPRLRN